MAQDLNSVMLVGRLARDIEMNQTGTVGRLSLVSNTNEKQQDGSYKDVANFFTVTLFGKRAQSLQQYLTKGVQIGVSGKLKYNSWQSQDGQKHNSVSIVADDIQLLARPQNQNNQSGGNYQQMPAQNVPQQQYQQAQQNFAPAQNTFQSVQQSQQVGFNPNGFEENIPF